VSWRRRGHSLSGELLLGSCLSLPQGGALFSYSSCAGTGAHHTAFQSLVGAPSSEAGRIFWRREKISSGMADRRRRREKILSLRACIDRFLPLLPILRFEAFFLPGGSPFP